jgi:hypothetical protein
MLGMFPPGTGPLAVTSNATALPYGIQPVPIHSVDLRQDSLLRGYKNCPRYTSLENAILKMSETSQSTNYKGYNFVRMNSQK